MNLSSVSGRNSKCRGPVVGCSMPKNKELHRGHHGSKNVWEQSGCAGRKRLALRTLALIPGAVGSS